MKKLVEELVNAGIDESEAKKEISILELEIKDSQKIKKIVEERIKTRTPLQYLLGKAYFMDFEVKVDPRVLIPRPETEILVEETVKRLVIARKDEVLTKQSHNRDNEYKIASPSAHNDIMTILDIGTGSGVIAIAFAKRLPDIHIVAIDVNKEVIALASENAKLNNVEDKIKFKICDVFSSCFEGLFKANKFDLIISNPPYVGACHGKPQQPEVRHEPGMALSGSKENKSGLIYYERILSVIARKNEVLTKQSHNCDNKGKIASPLARNDTKLLALEIDPPLVDDLKSLLKKNKLNNFEIVKDYAGLDRCLFVYL